MTVRNAMMPCGSKTQGGFHSNNRRGDYGRTDHPAGYYSSGGCKAHAYHCLPQHTIDKVSSKPRNWQRSPGVILPLWHACWPVVEAFSALIILDATYRHLAYQACGEIREICIEAQTK